MCVFAQAPSSFPLKSNFHPPFLWISLFPWVCSFLAYCLRSSVPYCFCRFAHHLAVYPRLWLFSLTCKLTICVCAPLPLAVCPRLTLCVCVCLCPWLYPITCWLNVSVFASVLCFSPLSVDLTPCVSESFRVLPYLVASPYGGASLWLLIFGCQLLDSAYIS